MTGTIKSTNRDRGFGFITGDDQIDYFFHRSGIDGVQFGDISEGDRVTFDIEAEAPRGPRAKTVRAIQSAAVV